MGTLASERRCHPGIKANQLRGIGQTYRDQLPAGGWFRQLKGVALTEMEARVSVLAVRRDFLDSRQDSAYDINA